MSYSSAPIVWTVTIAAMVSSVLVAAFVVPNLAAEVVLGMIGPVAVALGSFVMMDRTRRNPEHLTRLMVRAFLAKMVLFGAYVVLAVTVLSLDAVAFAASFTVYFVALHLAEAAHLQRIYVAGVTPSR